MENDSWSEKEIKAIHRPGILQLVLIFFASNERIKSIYSWLPIALSLVFFVTDCVFDLNKSIWMQSLNSINLQVLPNVLGFNLGAYVLLLSLGHVPIIDHLIQKSNKNRYTLFQNISSVFGFSLLIQSVTLILSALLHHFFLTGLAVTSNQIFTFVGTVVLVVYVFLTVYSFLLIIRICVNVFDFGQMLHQHYLVDQTAKKHPYIELHSFMHNDTLMYIVRYPTGVYNAETIDVSNIELKDKLIKYNEYSQRMISTLKQKDSVEVFESSNIKPFEDIYRLR